MRKIDVYGADWCPDCLRAKAYLEDNGIEYKYIDTSKNEAAGLIVENINNGKRIIPTFIIDGVSHTNPSNEQLDNILKADNQSSASVKNDGCSDFSCGIEHKEMEVGDESEY